MDEASVAPAAQQTRLRTDVFLTFGGKAAGLVLGLLIVVLIARELGPTRQGLFAVAFTLSLILIHLGGLGVTSANPYFAAREPRLLPTIVGNAVWLATGLGLLCVGIGIGVKVVAPALLQGLGWTPILIALAGVPPALAAVFLQSILLGEGRIVVYNTTEIGQFAITLALIASGFWLLDFGVTGVLAAVTAGRIAASIAYFVLLRQPLRRPDLGLARRMLGYGFRIYVAMISSFLVVKLDVLLVNGYLGSTEAGLYSVAATIADGMFLIPAVVGLNLFPRVARGDPTRASAEVFRSFAVLYGLLCVATLPLAGPGIRLVFGNDFEGAISLYYWLLPGIFSLGMLTILSHHFAGRGFPIQAMVIWLAGFVLNLALNLIFLPGRGAWVAALASSIAYTLLLALHMRLFAREAGGYGAVRPRFGEVLHFVRVALARS